MAKKLFDRPIVRSRKGIGYAVWQYGKRVTESHITPQLAWAEYRLTRSV
jgi:hypothetical protein